MVNSRRKGAAGELELAHALHEILGVTTRRTQQYSGTEGTSDVLVKEWPSIHLECKRLKRIAVTKHMEQAKRDCREDQLPVVMMREDRGEWLVMVPLDRLAEFVEVIG